MFVLIRCKQWTLNSSWPETKMAWLVISLLKLNCFCFVHWNWNAKWNHVKSDGSIQCNVWIRWWDKNNDWVSDRVMFMPAWCCVSSFAILINFSINYFYNFRRWRQILCVLTKQQHGSTESETKRAGLYCCSLCWFILHHFWCSLDSIRFLLFGISVEMLFTVQAISHCTVCSTAYIRTCMFISP